MILITLVLWLTVSPIQAGKFNRQLTPGDAAPGFTDLTGIDDQRHSLADYRDAKLVVLVFTCNHCPVAKVYEERLVGIAHEYEQRGVQFVAINASRTEADTLDGMKERAKESGYNFPYLRDASQAVARAYGVRVTPEIFVLDRERRVAYQGAVDDHLDAPKVKHAYLRDALEVLLADKQPETVETRPKGCAMTYEP